jgi:hypothetical protein
MNLSEHYRKFPIKFYKNLADDTIYYESGFTQGNAPTLNDAFKEFSRDDFIRDLYYYYSDVRDAKVGRYIPAIKDIKRKGKLYLGMLELELDIDPNIYDNTSVKFLNKNKQEIPKHQEWINNLKRKENMETTKHSLKQGVINLINKLRGKESVKEMFTPYKTATQLVCSHCGRVIPIATYYEEWRHKNYHLECIWDKLVNKMEENSFEAAEKFFHSLQKFIGHWPAYGYDVEDDYVSDLELVKSNNRITGHKVNSIKNIKDTLDYYDEENL